MTDLQILHKLEKQLNIKFKKVNIDKINFLHFDKEYKYAIEANGNIIALQINSIIIEDLILIVKLFNLKTLYLTNNQIKDISVLQNLKQIRTLNLLDNQIKDISVLQNLKQIKDLNLSDNQITDFSVLQNLKQIRTLNLSNNQIKDISVLHNLEQIDWLNLSNNQITDISALKNLKKIDYLDLSNNQIKDISVLENLTQIEWLYLSNNQIKDFSVLQNLKKIRVLGLSNNQITDISVLQNLEQIEWLYLSNNQIKDISVLQNLKKIRELDLSNNQIQDISVLKNLFNKDNFWRGDFKNNPLKFPPKEIVELGEEAIVEYFEQAELGTTILREAKIVIIGEAGAGKTTFAKKLENPNCKMPDASETTLGIDVYKYQFKFKNQDDFYTKLWDFGGQDIYHGTHQFFFSNRSLYVLISDARDQKTDFNYWLNTIEQLTGEDSPLVVLFNKKEGRSWQLDDEHGLKRRFPGMLKKIINIDLSKPEEIPSLQQAVQEQISSLPQIGYRLPTAWVNIRTQLSKLTDKYIYYNEFRKICKKNKITSPKVIEIISKLFTNIGVFTHFIDEETNLQDIIFLDSNWLTKTVYSIIDNKIVKENNGEVTRQHIVQILETEKLYFEIDKFIELLKKFSLIYRISGSDKYIVPIHLQSGQPYKKWKYSDETDIYQFRYLFDNYMPRGIMHKLIVALHPYIYDNDLVWKRGINITNSINKPDTYAEIIETYDRVNYFDIQIYGKKQKELLNIIIYHFDKILKPFKKLTHDKLIPCNCDTCKNSKEPEFHKYSMLLEQEEYNIDTIRCTKKPFLFADVKELFDGVNFTELRSLLINQKFDDFKELISQKFSDISYQIHKEKVSEGFFHSNFHTMLAENGLNPVSEESTNDGRIDLHLTIGDTKYLFELKLKESSDNAIKQIHEKKYYNKFIGKFNKIILIGITFSTKTRNIIKIKHENLKKNNEY